MVSRSGCGRQQVSEEPRSLSTLHNSTARCDCKTPADNLSPRVTNTEPDYYTDIDNSHTIIYCSFQNAIQWVPNTSLMSKDKSLIGSLKDPTNQRSERHLRPLLCPTCSQWSITRAPADQTFRWSCPQTTCQRSNNRPAADQQEPED